MLYFAYGSNMSLQRILARVPSARAHGCAALAGHRLVFHKIGRDGSAKCDIPPGDAWRDRVHGVLYRIDARHRPALDSAEGLGNGYAVRTVEVMTVSGGTARAFTYCATRIDDTLAPFPWYLHHVLRGAREHGLPDDYIAMIAATTTVPDPDPLRSAAEMAIYGQIP